MTTSSGQSVGSRDHRAEATSDTLSVRRRDPDQVMRLERLGSSHQSRLSFMRILLRRINAEGWQFTRPQFDIDEASVGTAVYSVRTPTRTYSLVAFSHQLADELRSDRVIAEAWDATFALFDGEPTAADIERLRNNVPVQEAGRVSEKELTLSRANKSVRLWAHVVESLAAGCQPAVDQIASVGYLMRTTAVYGSGKFGAADHAVIAGRPEMQTSFQAEMLTVYLIRTFVRDLVEHAAQVVGGDRAVRLDPVIARQLGIGNSTGLGMAPFIINHPVLFNNWLMAREEGIARVRSVETATSEAQSLFIKVMLRAVALIDSWTSDDPLQQKKLGALRVDVQLLTNQINENGLSTEQPWNHLVNWAERALSIEGQELVMSLIMEPYPDLVDGLSCCMVDHIGSLRPIDGSMSIDALQATIESTFGWVLDIDWQSDQQHARAWYVSEEKLEPRLGERFEEPLADYELALAPARDIAQAYKMLIEYCASEPDDQSVAAFLLAYPTCRQAVQRVQLNLHAPYTEIRDNTISAELMPIDMLRAKLAFFGATRFDPRSDRWLRISMFGGAPYPDEFHTEYDDLWVYPCNGHPTVNR